jgi:nucleoside-triphosphatase
MTGFWTEEVRDERGRTGFVGITLDGKRFRLADGSLGGQFRVGPYGVDVASLEAVGVPSLEPGPETQLVVLDEVGKMESFSLPFRGAVERLLAGPRPLLATVAAHGVGFPKRVRHDPRITLVRMTRASRGAVVGEILRALAAAGLGAPSPRLRRNA